MLDRLRVLLRDLGGRVTNPETPPDEASIAVVALALHVIRADGTVNASEEAALEAAIREHYGLDHKAYEQLLKIAKHEEDDAIDHYRFANHLKRHMDDRAKLEFVRILWGLVGSDGVHNELEDHLVWRIAEIIGVSGRDLTQRIAHPPAPSGVGS